MNDPQIPIQLNGRTQRVPAGRTLAELLADLELDRRSVVVELNREIVRRDELEARTVEAGDEVEVVHFVGGGAPAGAGPAAESVPESAAERPATAAARPETEEEPLEIAGRRFRSRLIVGTGKYGSPQEMLDTIRAAGAEMVTVAVRRVDLDADRRESLLHWLDPEEWFLLPNTAGCYSAEEAVRYARLGREAGLSDWVKLEVIGDEDTLMPDVTGLLEATRALVREGFVVLPYTNDDLVTALRLQDAGAAAVMPLASPIGSGLGLLNPLNIRILKSRLEVPVIVDAGVGTASDACLTMEQGVDGILMNTALAEAERPVLMGRAMRRAVEAGRLAWQAGRMARREWAVASSPREGMLD